MSGTDALVGGYRALLRLLPSALCREHGDEMAEIFAWDVERAGHDGPLAVARVAAAAYVDALRRAPREHWRRRRHEFREWTMRSFWNDLRFARRSFARQRSATALIVFTLTLAIAANVAVFTLVDAVFLRPFPLPRPNELVDINEQAPKWNLEFTNVNYPDFAEWHERTRSFRAIALYDAITVNVAQNGVAERIDGAVVTHDFPQVLEVRPVLGRFFLPEEDQPKGPKVVMLGYGLWQTRFAGARDVIGRSMRIDGEQRTIVGVLPPEAEFPNGAQLWLPMQGDPHQPYQSYNNEGIARLKPGVSIEQARRDLLSAQIPAWNDHDTARVVSPRIMPLRQRLVADVRTMGVAMSAGALLVLLIACANVAGAMLARAIFRQHEIAVRMAIGASRVRLARQLLTESLWLAGIAGILGTALGWWGLHALIAPIAQQLPPWMHVEASARAAAFAVALVGVTAALFGLAPMLELRRQSVRDAMGAGPQRGTSTVPQRRALGALVVAEIALACVLLAAGSLLVRTFANLRAVDPGIRLDDVATFRVYLPSASYHGGDAEREFYERAVARLASVPGVASASAISCAPLGCHWGKFYQANGTTFAPGQQDPVVLTRLASPEYFGTAGIRLLRGRFFRDGERMVGSAQPAVVNEQLARQLWPGVDDPTGRQFHARGDTSAKRQMVVIGVVHDARHYGLVDPMRPGLYLPLATLDSSSELEQFTFVVRLRGEPASVFPAIRAAMRELDPEVPIFTLRTMRTAFDQSLASRRLMALAIGTFAAIALTLAVGGIYAVLSYVVGRRRRELGIRIALGAQRAQVLRLVVRQGLVLVAIGLALGLPIALGASSVMSSLLVGVTARDPLTYVLVALAVIVVGVIAALVPASRASKVDPMSALS